MLNFYNTLLNITQYLCNSTKLKEKVEQGLQHLIKDDEVIQLIIPGFDEGNACVIVCTSKNLIVYRDEVIHCINKKEIISMDKADGILAKLVNVETIDNSVYFKVYTNKSFQKLENWLK